jgi:hypothetical protein
MDFYELNKKMNEVMRRRKPIEEPHRSQKRFAEPSDLLPKMSKLRGKTEPEAKQIIDLHKKMRGQKLARQMADLAKKMRGKSDDKSDI